MALNVSWLRKTKNQKSKLNVLSRISKRGKLGFPHLRWNAMIALIDLVDIRSDEAQYGYLDIGYKQLRLCSNYIEQKIQQ